MMNEGEALTAVRKHIHIERDVVTTFELWAQQVHAWWPRKHTLSGDPQTHVCIEGAIGGRFYERASDGKEYEWGRVFAWEPPHRIAFTWYLGSTPALPTQVEVQFTAIDAETTRIDLEHRGPEFIGDLWERRVQIFQGAWYTILQAVEAASKA